MHDDCWTSILNKLNRVSLFVCRLTSKQLKRVADRLLKGYNFCPRATGSLTVYPFDNIMLNEQYLADCTILNSYHGVDFSKVIAIDGNCALSSLPTMTNLEYLSFIPSICDHITFEQLTHLTKLTELHNVVMKSTTMPAYVTRLTSLTLNVSRNMTAAINLSTYIQLTYLGHIVHGGFEVSQYPTTLETLCIFLPSTVENVTTELDIWPALSNLSLSKLLLPSIIYPPLTCTLSSITYLDLCVCPTPIDLAYFPSLTSLHLRITEVVGGKLPLQLTKLSLLDTPEYNVNQLTNLRSLAICDHEELRQTLTTLTQLSSLTIYDYVPECNIFAAMPAKLRKLKILTLTDDTYAFTKEPVALPKLQKLELRRHCTAECWALPRNIQMLTVDTLDLEGILLQLEFLPKLEVILYNNVHELYDIDTHPLYERFRQVCRERHIVFKRE